MTLLPALLQALDVEINSFNLAGLLLAPVIAFHIVTTYLKPAPSAAIVDKWIWKPHLLFLPPQERSTPRPWYTSLILWWALVAAAYITLYALFW